MIKGREQRLPRATDRRSLAGATRSLHRQEHAEGEPEKLNAADSTLVAKYIHESFYSPVAQARNKTGADRSLAAHGQAVPEHGDGSDRQLSPTRQWVSGTGHLKADYYKGRRHDNKKQSV